MAEITKGTEKEKKHYAWVILVACCVFCFGFGMTANSMGQFFVPVTRELGLGMGQFTMYMTFSGLIQVASMTMLNKMLDKVKLRVLLTCCFVVRLSCTALMGTFHHLWQWYAVGVVMGVVGPPVHLVMPPIILSNWFVKKRGFAIGIAMMFSGLGGAVMNPGLAWIIENFGWRTAYVANSLIAGAVVLPFFMFVILLKPSDKGLKPYGYEEAATAAPESQGKPEGAEDAKDAKSAATGAPQERGVPWNTAVRSVSFILMVVIFAVSGFFGGYTQVLSAYGVSIGLSITAAAVLPSLCMVGNALTKLTMGAVNDRYGGKVMMYSGLGVVLIAMLLLLNGANPPAGLYIGAFLAGIFLTVMSVSSPLMVHTVYGARDYTRIFVTLSLAQNLLVAMGASIIGFMFDFTGDYTLSFITGAAVTVVTAALTYFAFRTSKKLAWE